MTTDRATAKAYPHLGMMLLRFVAAIQYRSPANAISVVKVRYRRMGGMESIVTAFLGVVE